MPILACILSFNVVSAEALGEAQPSQDDVRAAIEAADVLERRDAFGLAREQLRDVLLHVEDSGLRDELLIRVCELYRGEDDAGRARVCFLEAVPDLSALERRALARYHAGVLAMDLGHTQLGRLELAELAVELPETDGARRAVVYVRALRAREVGPAAEADILLGLASQIVVRHGARPLRLTAMLLTEAGRIRLDERRMPESAAKILADARWVAKGTVWEDDALYWSARAAVATDRPKQAERWYRALIDDHASSWLVGSYTLPYTDDAYLELGKLLEGQGRVDEALDIYEALPEQLPASVWVDDARFFSARLRARRGEWRPLLDFLTQHEDSRHAEAARAMLERR